MKHMNVVKFKVKHEKLNEFSEQAFKQKSFDGMLSEYYVNTGNNEFIAVGLWESEEKMIAARPEMIGFLDSIRHTLEELSPELGVTDPASGSVVFEG
jgi:hypothetical protein